VGCAALCRGPPSGCHDCSLPSEVFFFGVRVKRQILFSGLALAAVALFALFSRQGLRGSGAVPSTRIAAQPQQPESLPRNGAVPAAPAQAQSQASAPVPMPVPSPAEITTAESMDSEPGPTGDERAVREPEQRAVERGARSR
jgi:hypothetical protein